MTTVTFLGTGAVVPGGGGDSASFLINGRILVDTGWGAALRMRRFGFRPTDLDFLMLTHGHHDHYLGLPQILFYRAMRRAERPDAPPLQILGPAGDLERIVDRARRFLQTDRFPEADCEIEVRPLAPGDVVEDDAFRLAVCAARHPVPGLCGRFTDTGSGAVLVWTGDTAPHPPLAEHVRDADLLITEASYGPNPAPSENPALHSGAPDAAALARQAGVGRLALVHCPEERRQAALAAARAIFPNTFWPEDGETVAVG